MVKITLDEANVKLRGLIARNAPHEYYDTIQKDAKFWTSTVSGEGLEEEIRSYKPRETLEQKEQRVNLSNPPTPKVAREVMTNIDTLESDEGRVIVINHKDKTAKIIIDDRIKKFNGDRDLMRFLLDECRVKWQTQANAFLIVTFEAQRDQFGAFTEKPYPLPVVVPSENVYDVGKVNGEYSYLCTLSRMQTKEGKTWKKYSMYFTDYIIEAFQVVEGNMPPDGFVQEVIEVGRDSETYYFVEYKTMSGEVPFMPFGYIPSHRGDFFDSFFQPVKSDFKELLNNSSEYGLTTAMHVFLRGYAYAPKCTYRAKGLGMCENGTMTVSGSGCPACNGTGKQVVTTTQELVTLTMPDDNETFFDLSKMVHYPILPFDIVNHLKSEKEEAPRRIETALWGVDLKETPQGPITATEITKRYGSVYAQLSRMEQHIAAMWTKCVRLTATYAEVLPGLDHQFVARTDFQMETLSELMILLKQAREAFATNDTINAIERQIMKKQQGITPDAIKWSDAVYRFKPFKTKDAEQISEILSTMPEKEYYRVLWTFFDEIFADIQDLYPFFPELTKESQKKIVDDTVKIYSDKVTVMTMQEPTRSAFNLVDNAV